MRDILPRGPADCQRSVGNRGGVYSPLRGGEVEAGPRLSWSAAIRSPPLDPRLEELAQVPSPLPEKKTRISGRRTKSPHFQGTSEEAYTREWTTIQKLLDAGVTPFG